MPSSYPSELRRQVVELARSGTRVAQLADTCGMSAVSLYKWLGAGPRRLWGGARSDDRSAAGAGRREAAGRAVRDRAGGRPQGQRGGLERGHQPRRCFPVIDSLIGFSVRHACRTLGVSESGYCAWKAVRRPDSSHHRRRSAGARSPGIGRPGDTRRRGCVRAGAGTVSYRSLGQRLDLHGETVISRRADQFWLSACSHWVSSHASVLA
jgi:hypothetical protein